MLVQGILCLEGHRGDSDSTGFVTMAEDSQYGYP